MPLALENIAPLLSWPADELTEGQFTGSAAALRMPLRGVAALLRRRD